MVTQPSFSAHSLDARLPLLLLHRQASASLALPCRQTTSHLPGAFSSRTQGSGRHRQRLDHSHCHVCYLFDVRVRYPEERGYARKLLPIIEVATGWQTECFDEERVATTRPL